MKVIDSTNLGYLWGKIKASFFSKDDSVTIGIDSTPTQNSTNLVESGGVASALSGKEVASNKVTSLSSSSTDTQYPSAKCVYDLVNSMGSGYRLIASGTTTADVKDIIVTEDMNGNPLSLSDVIVFAKTRRVSSGYTGWVKLEFTCTTGTQVSGAILQQTAKDPNNDYYVTSLHRFKRIGNYLMPLTFFRSGNDASVKNSLVSLSSFYAVEKLTTVSGSINKVRLYGYQAGAIGEGTEYEIYGIDA